MLYTRVNNSPDASTNRVGAAPPTTHIEIQSWQFVVPNTNDGHVPWVLPVGMHYCKLLSPARVMEWLYTDALRHTCGAISETEGKEAGACPYLQP
jgi:hypothetical protein